MPNSQLKRLFISLNLPKDAKNKIAAAIINKLSDKNKGVKWVNPAGLHFTLHFLGDLNKIQTDEVKKIMGSLEKKFKKMEFNLNYIKAFPNSNRPRIIFLQGQQTNGDSVFKLQAELGKKLIKIGLKIDRRIWQPHITLGRVKFGQININFTKINEVKFNIDTYSLTESQLEPAGPRYTEVIGFKLL